MCTHMFIYIYIHICTSIFIYIYIYLNICGCVQWFKGIARITSSNFLIAGVSRAGARTWLQLTGHGDMQGFDSSSLAWQRWGVDWVCHRVRVDCAREGESHLCMFPCPTNWIHVSLGSCQFVSDYYLFGSCQFVSDIFCSVRVSSCQYIYLLSLSKKILELRK